MLDPFVENFLKSYEPKQLDLSPYLKLDKLKGYKFMEKSDDKLNLIPGETYVKYINRSDAFKDKDLKMHVRGGILLEGGTYVNGLFKPLGDNTKWTHLMLLFSPFPTGLIKSKKGFGHQKIYDYDQHIFYIKINSYYLFYKYFNHK
ncbi:hypothetical protein QJ857_gp0401 [Tupanvirus soda lake]|uniref:Uncharacterized protein n=2 Tax=Tupanvirus TaxID=2094720 RepID=A0A6N1NWP8_9VIRU|nr:hypothetical protein QJ857_gp0401 [Tupanvirus soda lake]QKU35633.1 hypothetical protein [Tupanvirus soda lake]